MPSIVKAGYIRAVEPKQRTDATENDSTQPPVQSNALPTEYIDEHTKERLLGEELFALRRKVDAESEDTVRKAQMKAQIILAEAGKKAKDIIGEAEGNAEIVLREAEAVGYQQGYKQGTKEGLASSDEKIKACAEDIRQMVHFVKEENCKALQDNEKDLAMLSFEIAKKIMRQQIKVDDESIPRMIEEIIKENEKTVKVYLSEINRVLKFKVDRRMYGKIKALSENLRVIVIKEDEDGNRKDTIQVETETGMIDASIDGQLKRLKEEMNLE